MSRSITKRGPKPKETPPIESAIRTWLAGLPLELTQSCSCSVDELVNVAPKRFVIYGPMALLPSGSFTDPQWARLLRAVDNGSQARLWNGIVGEISRRNGGALTHLAANDGIPSHLLAAAKEDESETTKTTMTTTTTTATTTAEDGSAPEENVLRSPTGLRMLHGDFGPGTGEDVDAAFWVSTRQNGITQVWAPRWTMFSRGNVKEKGRLLSFHDEDNDDDGEDGRRRRQQQQQWAVDLYAGIGYFAFSYARLGMRVLCWEINPWSVEGLRRGARANGWSVKVVRAGTTSTTTTSTNGAAINEEEEEEDVLASGEHIIVFLEDNGRALGRIRAMGDKVLKGVGHVNCGFLPTSERSWRMAWEIAEGRAGGGEGGHSWLHLHENVGVADIESRRMEIQRRIGGWARGAGEGEARVGDDEGEARVGDDDDGDKDEDKVAVVVEHVEKVKTFAPGVWHCVFDVHLSRRAQSGE